MKKNWFSKKILSVESILSQFFFQFQFHVQISLTTILWFCCSHSYRRCGTWSNLGSKNEILFPDFLPISFILSDTISNQRSIDIHVLVVSSILAHMGFTIGKMWGKSALESTSQVRYPYQFSWEMDHGEGVFPNWVLSVLEVGWFTILGNPQLRLEVWPG